METITVERVIAAPIQDVFAWLTTTTNYTAARTILRCRLDRPGADAPYGVGAVRVHLWTIGYFRERITRYEPPYVTEYVVDRSVPASRHELGRMTFAEVDGGTHVVWTTRAEAKIPLIGPFVTRVLAKRMITRTFSTILAAADTALTRATV
ncbi:MxaD family protein [Actinosynnema sp. ALI-1.44]|uniref:SRPBCC family protein n=1 Tax=Actinosynnema sp. ALI-1.44 TaxID=1933779 RepID=UPI00097C256D|nr:SRPBCC family protein [Actinosynnema sp. ALI-1.44]ONI75206.1 MxaD family protein [Actinosynnema sp. ALI-1.44]